MAIGTTNITSAANFIPEKWSLSVSHASESVTVLSDLVDRQYDDEMRHGDILRIQDLSNPAVRLKSTDTALTYSNINETQQAITINRHAYVAFLVEDIGEIQANIDLRGQYTAKTGYSLAAFVEGDLTSGLASLPSGFSQLTGSLGSDITDDAVLRAVQYLDDGDVPEDGRFFYMAPSGRVALLKIDKFTRQEYVGQGSAERAVKRARIGVIYGASCYVSSLANANPAAAGQSYAWFSHPRGVALIEQRAPTSHTDYILDQLGWAVAVDTIYQFAERAIAPSTLGGGTPDDRFNVGIRSN